MEKFLILGNIFNIASFLPYFSEFNVFLDEVYHLIIILASVFVCMWLKSF